MPKTATMTAPRNRMTKCGFCNDGAHDRCPGVIQNGDHGLWRCTCDAAATCGQNRCTDCNNRKQDEVDDKGHCIDRDACASEIERRRLAWSIDYPTAAAALDVRPDKTSKKSVVVPSRPSTGVCICCGEPTKGGLFLPGHDARWLSTQVKCVTEGVMDRREVRDYMAGRGVSAALLAKFDRRVGL